MVEFVKLHGAGNDFVVMDNRKARLPAEDHTRYARWCDRHFGVGADGLILLEDDPEVDFRMRYYNADGHPGSFCGNGARCALWQALHWGFFGGPEGFFRAGEFVTSGHVLDRNSPGSALIVMPAQVDVPIETPPDGDAWLNTGSPHVLVMLRPDEDLDALDLPALALPIRHNPLRMGGTNVNYIQPQPDGSLRIRTFERGVEAETLACGTGVTAAAIYWARQQQLADGWQVTVHARGGTLFVNGRQTGRVLLGGPVAHVFNGFLESPAFNLAGWAAS